MQHRTLGRTGRTLSTLGYGAFKIGRNENMKYAKSYDLPTEDQVDRLLGAVLDMGITYIDTAPAYGLSEERIGRSLAHRSDEFFLSTKVGETFEHGSSHYDFSAAAVRASIDRSRRRLHREVLDLVYVHSDGNDTAILDESDVVPTLTALRDQGVVKYIGFSGKTATGARAALAWADAIMVEYHLDDRSHEEVIAEAAQAGVGVVVKKGLASGRLPAREALRFVLSNPAVTSVVVGGLNVEHLRANVAIA